MVRKTLPFSLNIVVYFLTLIGIREYLHIEDEFLKKYSQDYLPQVLGAKAEKQYPNGVAAINTPQDVYKVGDLIVIGMSVLDGEGKAICDANIQVNLLDPYGKPRIFSSNKNQVRPSKTCEEGRVTNNPDYTIKYVPDIEGEYKMDLVTFVDGRKVISSNKFFLYNTPDTKVKRNGPTRLVVKEKFKMEIEISSKESYSGEIKEAVPLGFEILPSEDFIIEKSTNYQTLIWTTVDLEPRKMHTLTYSFIPPNVHGDFNELGYLVIGKQREARKWQLVTDPPGTLTLEVTDPCIGTPNCDPANADVGTDTVTFDYTVTAFADDVDHTLDLYFGASTGAGSNQAGTNIPSTACSGGTDPIRLNGSPTVDNSGVTVGGCQTAAWNSGSELVAWDSNGTLCNTGDVVNVIWNIEFCSEAAGNTYDIDTECAKSGGVAGCDTTEYVDEWNVNSSINYTQNDFEWFVTANSVTLTNLWPPGNGENLAENTYLTSIPGVNEPLETGDQIRIQMNFTLGGGTLAATTQGFKLQYDAADDCTTASGWADVGAKASGTIWRLFDEASIGDSTAQVNDIDSSTASAEGYYSEINASGTNPNEVLDTENSEWDWPVENNGAADNTTYCFRMVLSDGTPFGTYASDGYPKLDTAPGPGNLMRHGNFYKGEAEQGFFWAN